jgi:hypothetical protein
MAELRFCKPGVVGSNPTVGFQKCIFADFTGVWLFRPTVEESKKAGKIIKKGENRVYLIKTPIF